MKTDLHPTYNKVVFQDASADYAFLTRSTATSDKTIKWEDGNEYPLISLDISSASHPFYTGKQKLLDTAGRVDKFQARAAQAEKLRAEHAQRTSAKAARQADAEIAEIEQELEEHTVDIKPTTGAKIPDDK